MRGLRRFIWRFMVIFSFIVNVVLVVVVAFLLLTIFQINENIAKPLVGGLHSSFVGLDEATIDWTIPVRENVPVKLTIPISMDTTVVLTEAVPLSVVADITAPALTLNNATVNLDLPVDLELPVNLDIVVEVDDTLPVELDVRAVIPLQETQLHDVADSLRLLLEPIAIGLHNAPEDWGGAIQMVGDALGGNPPNLLAENDYSRSPWPGFSVTAGLNYPDDLLAAPVPEGNQAVETGIVPLGGIPALDAQIRPALYQDDMTPAEINRAAVERMTAQGVLPPFFDGGFNAQRLESISSFVPQSAGGFTNPNARPGADDQSDIAPPTP